MQKRIPLSILVLLACNMVICSLSSSAHAEDIKITEPLNPVEIKNLCLRNNPVDVVSALLDNDGKNWKKIIHEISAGQAIWIDLSACLAHGATYSPNASVHITLHIAWAEALPKNPVAILRLENFAVSTKWACSFPFIEMDPTFSETYLKRSLTALDNVTNPYLQEDKEICKMRLLGVYNNMNKKTSGQ